MGKRAKFVSNFIISITVSAALYGCTAYPYNLASYGQTEPQAQPSPATGGFYIDPATHLVTEAPSPPFYITDDGIIEDTPPGQTLPPGAQPCESDVLAELQPGSACYAAALRGEQESQAENDREVQSEKEQGNPTGETTATAKETCGVADGTSLRASIERAMAPPGGGVEPQVVQLINWQMAQTTLGWACTVEVDFLGGSYQVLAYERLPDGRYRMQTQLMGQAPIN